MAELEILVKMKDEASKQLDSLGKNIEKHSKTIRNLGIGMMATGTAVVGGLTAMGKQAADFDNAMREVNTMIGLSNDEFEGLKDTVQSVASEVGKSTDEMAGALYQIVSAGIDSAHAIDVLNVAAKAAVAGVTDVETAADGLTTVLNAFKISSQDASHVADVMFTTVKRGKTNFEEISSAMFNVAPMAANAGIQFEEVAAALATITKQGVPTSVATTQLRAAIQAIIKPTEDMKDALESMGYASGEALIEEKGLAGSLEALRRAAGTGGASVIDYSQDIARLEERLRIARLQQKEFTKDTKDSAKAAKEFQINELLVQLEDLKLKQENAGIATSSATEMLGKMFGSVEGLSAVLSVTGENAETFAEDLAATSEDAAGAVEEAYAEMNEGVARQFETLMNDIKIAGEKIGAALLPIFKKIIDSIVPIVEKIQAWADANPALVEGLFKLGGILIGAGGILIAISQVTKALTAFNIALAIFHALSGPAGWIKLAAGIAIAGGAVAALWALMGGFGGGGRPTTGGAVETAPGSGVYRPPTKEELGMQYGGIVTRPTRALIGERGPEAVIPLNKRNMGGINVYINVEGSIRAERDLAEVIRREIVLTKFRNYNTGL